MIGVMCHSKTLNQILIQSTLLHGIKHIALGMKGIVQLPTFLCYTWWAIWFFCNMNTENMSGDISKNTVVPLHIVEKNPFDSNMSSEYTSLVKKTEITF